MMAKLMGLKTISPSMLQENLQTGGMSVFDVNSPQSWSQAHVPGAKRLDPEAFTPSDLPTDKAATLVFYCSNPMCRKAPNAAKRAKAMGWTNVLVMDAGITGWTNASLPTESLDDGH